jgi:DNA-nicking Smr family endonuclease
MRKLSAEDRRLWDFVTQSVTPLKPRHASVETESPAIAPPRRAFSPVFAVAAPAAHRPTHHQPLHVGRLVDLDGATAKKFRKGRMPCDAQLDLHGFTLASAHSALVHFVRTQSARGARCLLVITGKGQASTADDAPRGRIKAELMHWLNASPLRPLVLAVTPAQKGNAGGAVYVLLKRRDRIQN